VKKYEKGWMEHYLKPLAKYFAKGGKQVAAKPAEPKKLSWGRRPEVKTHKKAGPAKKKGSPAPKKAARRPPPKKRAPAKRRRR
jgi:hypothetical protein